MVRLVPEPSDRLKSACAVTAIHLLIGTVLLRGLEARVEPAPRDAQQLIQIALDPLPPPTTPAPADTAERVVAKAADAEGAASPANRTNSPTQVVAPTPDIRLPLPPSIVTAPVAGQGNAALAGAAVFPGPGTGAGGIGNGLGSGQFGNGAGGGGGGRGVRARFLKGSIDPDDYPTAAVQRRAQGTTFLRFTVQPNGRVRNCTVTRSSGHRDLDSVTCPLLERRLRYRPARDAAGRPVAETITGRHDWGLGPEPPVKELEGELVEE